MTPGDFFRWCTKVSEKIKRAAQWLAAIVQDENRKGIVVRQFRISEVRANGV
jgi:hypothetical protein